MSQLRVGEIRDEAGSTSTPPLIPGLDPQLASAWVNFNGTGTVAIRASHNVASITDNGAGDYTVNFATAMDSANYSMVGSMSHAPTSQSAAVSVYFETVSVNDVRLNVSQAPSTLTDVAGVNVVIFGR